MAILIVGGTLFGAILGRIFKVFVLIPTVALAIALHLVRREVAGHTWLNSFLGIGLLSASLELGYVPGLISTDIFAAAQVFRGFLAAVAALLRRAQPTSNNRPVLADASRRERSSSAFY